jgi:VWFA-related protein
MIACPPDLRSPRGRILGAALLALAMGGAITTADSFSPQKTFRSAVDLIAVDVQVVDGDGYPVAQLGPEAFEVSIKGHRRKVVSASFVRHTMVVRPGRPADAGPPAAAEPADAPSTGRTYILAVDSGSFDVGAATDAMRALQDFVSRLEPNDRVGLYVYPTVVWVAPTTLRAPLRVALQKVLGERQSLRSRYNLKPAEIVDITAQTTNPSSFLFSNRSRGVLGEPTATEDLDPVLKVQRRECPEDADCPSRIYAEGMELALQLEHQTQASLGGLEFLMTKLAEEPGRKAVVLVSAGVLVSDRLDGRPDVGDMARVIGQTAARANATVYTVHVDLRFSRSGSASQRGSASADGGRDRALFGNWLDNFSSAAGGKRIYVPVGDGAYAFDRVLRESSAYYLLGVEPADADRDGRPHELTVKVHRRKVAVRSRQWVIMPAGV